MPEKRDRLMRDLGNHVVGVVVAIRAGKNQHPEFHAFRVSASPNPRTGAGKTRAAGGKCSSQITYLESAQMFVLGVRRTGQMLAQKVALAPQTFAWEGAILRDKYRE